MKIAIAQIDSRLGDFSGNSKKMFESIRSSQQQGVDLVVFPEAALCGYPASDLLEWPDFVKVQLKFLDRLAAKLPTGIQAIVGCYTENLTPKGRPYFNSVAILKKGRSPQFVHKEVLPVGDIFDEGRYFQEYWKPQNRTIKVKGKTGLIVICEEMWAWKPRGRRGAHVQNPLEKLADHKPDFILNLSASPFHTTKMEERLEMAKATTQFFKAPLIYVNRVGAQDEVIFDGRSFLMSQKGQVLKEALPFAEDLLVIEDFAASESSRKKTLEGKSSLQTPKLVRSALVEGLRSFIQNNGFTQVHLGLSGGIDSAVVLALAAEAIGAENVTALALPTEFNSPKSLKLAREMSKLIGCKFLNHEIQSTFRLAKENLARSFGIKKFGLVHENLQARIRALYLMAYSNTKGSLLLSTSNKSEAAVGYATLYGDMCGGLAPIADLTKNQVYALARDFNKESLERTGKVLIPVEIIERAPSAELRKNQKDQDSLPAYSELDAWVDQLIIHPDSKNPRAQATSMKWLKEKLLKSEFKRWQSPPILKVAKRSFGKGRRWPITLHTKDWL